MNRVPLLLLVTGQSSLTNSPPAIRATRPATSSTPSSASTSAAGRPRPCRQFVEADGLTRPSSAPVKPLPGSRPSLRGRRAGAQPSSSRTSSTVSTSRAPSFMSAWQPRWQPETTLPGTASTSRPCSSAVRAVISEPLRSAASTTTTASDKPADDSVPEREVPRQRTGSRRQFRDEAPGCSTISLARAVRADEDTQHRRRTRGPRPLRRPPRGRPRGRPRRFPAPGR